MELYLLLTTVPTVSFLALVVVTALVLVLVLALAAIIDSTDLHLDRLLEERKRGIT